MTPIDWAILAIFVLASVGIALWRGRRAGSDTSEFFIAGRQLGWFMAGTSMVATTFSSDTPLFVSGAVRAEGVYANWIWWSSALGTLASVFFFAQLWRRSEVTTEVEVIELRYGPGRATAAVRMFKALLDGAFVNCLIMASVTFAAVKVAESIMGLPSGPLFYLPGIGGVSAVATVVGLLGLTAVAYSTRTGFNGVVYTDAMQFGIAMLGAITLAVVTMLDLGDKGAFVEVVRAAAVHKPELTRFFPEPGWNLPFATFCILMTVAWLPLAPGTGYFLQRVLASRTERDAALGFSWFAFCHYVLRSWPWIIVGAASLVYFPQLSDNESAYPHMINLMLPAGVKGVVVMSLLAAFMSCVTSQLNWGSSYLVNDIYKPYMVRGRPASHYVLAARLSMAALAVVTGAILPHLDSILGVYKYLGVIATGATVALVGRWYWWRMNVWGEIAGSFSSIAVGSALMSLLPDTQTADLFAVRMLLNLLISGLVTVLVTIWTSSEVPDANVMAFYRRIRPPGPGWKRVANLADDTVQPDTLGPAAKAWLGSAGLLYGALLAPGFLIFGQLHAALAWMLVALTGLVMLRRSGFRFGGG